MKRSRLLQRSGLKRTAFKRTRKPSGMNTELRERVLKRDGYLCFWRRWDVEHGVEPPHACQSRLSYDHVKPLARMGKAAPDREQDATALCLDANVRGVPQWIREAQRAYLRELYGA